MKNIALSLALAALAAAGCASKDEKPAEVTQATPSTTPRSSTATGPSTIPAQTSRPSEYAHNDPNSPLAKRSVFFDFDSNVVKDEYQGTVQAHSRYLGDKRDLRIRIEGNTD